MTLRQATTFLFTTSYEECEDRFTIDTHNAFPCFSVECYIVPFFSLRPPLKRRLQRPGLNLCIRGSTGRRCELAFSTFLRRNERVQLMQRTGSAVTSLPQGGGGGAYTGNMNLNAKCQPVCSLNSPSLNICHSWITLDMSPKCSYDNYRVYHS